MTHALRSFLCSIFLCAVTSHGCTQPNPDNSRNRSDSLGNCETTVTYGGVAVCLPIVAGWKESLHNPLLSNRRGALVDSANTTLGIYISSKQWELGSALQMAILNDYFKVYATKAGEQFKVKPHQLPLIINEFNGSAMKSDWSKVKSFLEGKYSDVNLGRPVLMESYMPNDRVGTNVYLSRTTWGEKEMFTLMTLSLCIVKDRLVFVAHYLEYGGEPSVKAAKSKSDYFMLRFCEENG